MATACNTARSKHCTILAKTINIQMTTQLTVVPRLGAGPGGVPGLDGEAGVEQPHVDGVRGGEAAQLVVAVEVLGAAQPRHQAAGLAGGQAGGGPVRREQRVLQQGTVRDGLW